MTTPYQDYIHISRYARYNDEVKRRETWDETVDRVKQFWLGRTISKLHAQIDESMEAVRRMEVMPSMRVMMSAGKALENHHVAGYNCAYVPIDDPRVFSEILYVLMCGTGVGYSVEDMYVSRLPMVSNVLLPTDTKIIVKDSKMGWAASYRELVSLLYAGRIPSWDMSKIRPAGSRLKTFGGRASGPEPLNELFEYTVKVFNHAKGRRLTTLESHDLVCKVASVVVVGGVRRSALISLSDLGDSNLRDSKRGEFYLPENHPYRSYANNSIAYKVKPSVDDFLSEMLSLHKNQNGERGIFNREAAVKKYTDHRRDENQEWGCNPCSEILLRPKQFCNLTEIIVRADDTLDVLKEKIKHAAFLGTLQASLTDFKFLSARWKHNCAEEALLGVSMTGCCDHPLLNAHKLSAVKETELVAWFRELKQEAIKTNEHTAKQLGINSAAAVTCVKPSGTVSQLCNTASGLHPRFAPYYLRRVRNDIKDPLCQFMIDQGIPHEVDKINPAVMVFSFPMAAPKGSLVVAGVGAIDQLKTWQLYNDEFTEHKPSVTIYYTDDEFMDAAAYVWEHFDSMSGISFLPFSDAKYEQAPYEELDKETYERLQEVMPKSIDWAGLTKYENSDNTSFQPELACHGGACEL